MIEIKNLTKIYNKSNVKAVNDLSLTINDGDLLGFIGPNGAGKTTTIKSIVGILDFEKGEILINGKSIKKDPIKCKQEMAYIPDNPDLYETLTGFQYVNFIADMYEVPIRKRKENIKKYSEMFEMYDNLGNIIESYSHGMKQKLAIIAAFIHEPKILIMDEPFVGLDPKASYILKSLMKDFCSKGNSVLFSTHVLEVAQEICSRVAIIKKGTLMINKQTKELKDNKQNLEKIFLDIANEGDTVYHEKDN